MWAGRLSKDLVSLQYFGKLIDCDICKCICDIWKNKYYFNSWDDYTRYFPKYVLAVRVIRFISWTSENIFLCEIQNKTFFQPEGHKDVHSYHENLWDIIGQISSLSGVGFQLIHLLLFIRPLSYRSFICDLWLLCQDRLAQSTLIRTSSAPARGSSSLCAILITDLPCLIGHVWLS